MQCESEKTPVVLIVHVDRKVGEEGRCRIGYGVEYFDPARLLGDEDAAVGREFDVHRLIESGQDGLFAKARRQHGRGRRRG
nr:hypothetical protein GCM10020092_046240 [Actinoplanes digitatis]